MALVSFCGICRGFNDREANVCLFNSVALGLQGLVRSWWCSTGFCHLSFLGVAVAGIAGGGQLDFIYLV